MLTSDPPLRGNLFLMFSRAVHELAGKVFAAWVRNPAALQGIIGYVVRHIFELAETWRPLLLPLELVFLKLDCLAHQHPKQKELNEEGPGDETAAVTRCRVRDCIFGGG